MSSGEQHGWEQLGTLSPEAVCLRTGATYDREANVYGLDVFSARVNVAPGTREMSGDTPQAEKLLAGLSFFSHRSILGFLIHGQAITPSGHWVTPGEMPGVDAMVRGSHTLPLDKLAARYATCADAFVQRAETWGGHPESFGDAAVCLHPFTGLPMLLILWTGDEEFPARSSLLLDTTSRSQVTPEILWCVMMLTVLAML
jgi:hypothetical protein